MTYEQYIGGKYLYWYYYVMNDNEYLYHLASKYHYDGDEVLHAMFHRETADVHPIKDQFLTILDERYPEQLRELHQPPIHLCYQGDITLLQRPMLAVIGSREHSEYGASVVADLMRRLPNELVIVSGLAKGIDGIAHREAIAHGLSTIGVIGSGLKTVYPKENEDLFDVLRSHHLIVSEYQYDEPVRKHHFPARNRIIAGLADVLVVIESKVRSGSSTTVKEALELGKDVYCVPHRLSDELGAGNHLMIQEGANMIYDLDVFVSEVCEQYNLTNHKIRLR